MSSVPMEHVYLRPPTPANFEIEKAKFVASLANTLNLGDSLPKQNFVSDINGFLTKKSIQSNNSFFRNVKLVNAKTQSISIQDTKYIGVIVQLIQSAVVSCP